MEQLRPPPPPPPPPPAPPRPLATRHGPSSSPAGNVSDVSDASDSSDVINVGRDAGNVVVGNGSDVGNVSDVCDSSKVCNVSDVCDVTNVSDGAFQSHHHRHHHHHPFHLHQHLHHDSLHHPHHHIHHHGDDCDGYDDDEEENDDDDFAPHPYHHHPPPPPPPPAASSLHGGRSPDSPGGDSPLNSHHHHHHPPLSSVSPFHPHPHRPHHPHPHPDVCDAAHNLTHLHTHPLTKLSSLPPSASLSQRHPHHHHHQHPPPGSLPHPLPPPSSQHQLHYHHHPHPGPLPLPPALPPSSLDHHQPANPPHPGPLPLPPAIPPSTPSHPQHQHPLLPPTTNSDLCLFAQNNSPPGAPRPPTPPVPPSLRKGFCDAWHWDACNKSHEVRLCGRRLTTAFFHPNWSNGTAGVRGTKAVNQGVHYWEIKISGRLFGTSMMFGVATRQAALHADSFLNLLGQDAHSWGLSHKGVAWHGGRQTSFCAPFPENVAVNVGMVYDGGKGTLEYFKDGVSLGVAFRGLRDVADDVFPALSSTAAKTEMTLGVRRRAFLSLQDRCRAALVQRLVLCTAHCPPPRNVATSTSASTSASTSTSTSASASSTVAAAQRAAALPLPKVLRNYVWEEAQAAVTSLEPRDVISL